MSATIFQLPSSCLVKTVKYLPWSVMGLLSFGFESVIEYVPRNYGARAGRASAPSSRATKVSVPGDGQDIIREPFKITAA
jgi:hypothetical protein